VKNDSVYLKHILDSIRRIEEDISQGREKFLATHTLQDAVLRNLQTLSESVKRLSDPAKTSHPEIEWRRITAFRWGKQITLSRKESAKKPLAASSRGTHA